MISQDRFGEWPHFCTLYAADRTHPPAPWISIACLKYFAVSQAPWARLRRPVRSGDPFFLEAAIGSRDLAGLLFLWVFRGSSVWRYGRQ